MAEFREDTGIFPTMLTLAECAQRELVKSGLPEIDKVTLQPGGTSVMDYVGNGKDCGEITVNFTQSYPVNPFPTPDATGSCASAFAYEIVLAIFRCSPSMDGSKQSPRPPSPVKQLAATRLYTADMAAMRRAIQCCMQENEMDYALRAWTPYGPSGLVVGGWWTVVVGGPQ